MPRPASDRPYVCGPYKHRAKYRLVIYTGRRRPRGGRESYRRGFDTEEQAKRWKREFRRQVAAAGRTVGDAVAEFTDYLEKKKGNKVGSIATSRYRLAALLDFDMALVDLTARRAQDLYDEMIEEGYARGDAAKTYANDTHHGSLREAKTFARFCMSRSWLSANPFDKVEAVGKKKRRKKQLRVDEARTFARHCLQAWEKTRDRSAIAAAMPLQFNLRASEVSQLVSRDVDDRGRLLWVADNVDEATGEDLAKTESSKRTTPVPPRWVPILRWLADHPATDKGHLFAKESGQPADRHWVRYWVQEHAKDAGVPQVSTHGLRGTWASLKARAGASEKSIGEEMGHADDGRTASSSYIDPAVAADAQTAAVADTLFDGVPEPVDPEATPRHVRPSDPDDKTDA